MEIITWLQTLGTGTLWLIATFSASGIVGASIALVKVNK